MRRELMASRVPSRRIADPSLRTASEIYQSLNRPSKVRIHPANQASGSKKLAKKLQTDTSAFKRVTDSTSDVLSLMSSARDSKSSEIMDWIGESCPSPIEILQKVAQVSHPHQSIINRVVSELSRFPSSTMQDTSTDLMQDAKGQMPILLIKAHDFDESTRKLEEEKKFLIEKLSKTKDALKEVQSEFEKTKCLMRMSTFQEAQSKERSDNRENKAQTQGSMYNELWGENKHLKIEAQRLLDRLNEARQANMGICLSIATKRNSTVHAIEEEICGNE